MRKFLFLFLLLIAFFLGGIIHTESKKLLTVRIIRINNTQKTDIEKEIVGQDKIKLPSKSDVLK